MTKKRIIYDLVIGAALMAAYFAGYWQGRIHSTAVCLDQLQRINAVLAPR